MIKPIEKPNIPAGPAALCAVGKKYGQAAEALSKRDINVLTLTPDERLDEALQSHADMLICPVGGPEVVCGSEANYRALAAAGLRPIAAERTPEAAYPMDAHLNQLILGGHAIGLENACDPVVRRLLQERGVTFTYVRQGYARCSAAAVAENALITADYAIAKAAVELGLDVLVIRPGYIELPGYDYGFIGGACGLIAPDCLALTGDITRHPDAERMIAFAKKYGVGVDCLSDGPLTDIGGILTLMEKAYPGREQG